MLEIFATTFTFLFPRLVADEMLEIQHPRNVLIGQQEQPTDVRW